MSGRVKFPVVAEPGVCSSVGLEPLPGTERVDPWVKNCRSSAIVGAMIERDILDGFQFSAYDRFSPQSMTMIPPNTPAELMRHLYRECAWRACRNTM